MAASTHATAAILSLGDELVLGQSLDTNSRWLAEQLLAAGIVTREHVTVADDAGATTAALRRLAASVDLIVSTGGLGPTMDDLTRQALADAMGEPLVEDAESLEQVRRYFTRAGRAMPEPNRVQALRPASAAALRNDNGTAPGLAASIARPDGGSSDVFCLPGPPREMKPMFERDVRARLRPPLGRVVRTRVLHTFGIGESDIAARLGAIMDRTRTPLVGTTASRGVVSCRLRFEGAGDAAAAELALDTDADEIRARLGPYVFGAGEDTPASVVLGLLRQRGETLAVAESCTGGGLGEMMTEVPGSSAAFLGGWITYTNEWKQAEVGVPASVFSAGGPGAVSRECAEAMARGALEYSPADHALAITGIAGPDGGTPQKPVGTVWIAQASRKPAAVESRLFVFSGDRAAVREIAAKSALAMLRLHLVGAGDVRLLRQRDP